MCKYTIKIIALVAVLLGSIASAQAQENLLHKNIKTKNSFYNSNDTFEKIEKFFFTEKYSMVLIEISKLNGEALNSYQESILPFYESVSEAYMLSASAVETISEFLAQNNNHIYSNIALALLAEELLKDGQLSDAGQLFKQVTVGALPKSMAIRYNYYYGKYLLDSNQYLEARYRFTQASLSKSAYFDDAVYYLSYIKYSEGDYSEAKDGFKSLAAKSKYDKSSIYVAQIDFVNGDFQNIVDDADKLKKVAQGDDELELYRILGESYYNLNNYSEAIVALDKYRELGGIFNSEQNYIMGYCYYMNNVYPMAIQYFTKIINGESQMKQNAYYHLADSYLKTGDKKGALRAFSMAAVMDDSAEISEDALYNQVKLTYETGGGDVYSQIIELMQRFLNKYPSSEHSNEINGYLLSVYINTSDYDSAINAIEKVKNPSNTVLSALQRMCYEQALEKIDQNQYSEAIDMLDKTIKYDISPKYSALSVFWKAECLSMLGDFDNSIDMFSRFIHLSTPQVREYMFAHYNIAYIYFNNKDWDNAILWLNKFVDKYDSNDIYKTDAINRIGDIYFGKSDYAAAIDNYSDAAKINSSGVDYPKFQTAISYGLMNNIDSKIKQLKEIISTSETIYKDMAIVELAATYNRDSKYKSSEKLLTNFVTTQQQSPYYISGLLEMAVACTNQNKNDDAIKYYKQIVVNFPSSVETKDALLALKSIYVSEGKAAQYIDFVGSQNVVEIDNSEKESISFEAIQHQYLTNEVEKVIKLGNEYNIQYPNGTHSVDVTYYMGEAYMKTNDHKKALIKFNQIIDMPNNQYTISSLSYLDQIYMNSGNNIERYNVNEKIYSFSSDEVIRQKSLEVIMTLSLEIGVEDNIIKTYNKVLSDPKATKHSLSLANFAKGKLAFNRKDYVTTFASLRKSAISVSKKEGAESEYMKAVILFSEKKFDDAETMILAFASKGTPHQFWLAKSFILLGDIYVERNDLFQAKATFQSILEGYTVSDDGIVSEVKSKIKMVDKEAEIEAVVDAELGADMKTNVQ